MFGTGDTRRTVLQDGSNLWRNRPEERFYGKRVRYLVCGMAMVVSIVAATPDTIPVFTAGSERFDGVEKASEKYPQYREQNVVVTKSGRVVLAGGDFYKGKRVLCFYSDDHGETWQRSKVVPWEGKVSWASESKVAELPDGTLVLNSRTFVADGAKDRVRTRAFSKDGGVSWTRLENDPTLETVSCNGALLAVSDERGKDGAILLCSVPVGPKRTHGTVYVSFDGGKTWPRKRVVVPGPFAYSSLVRFADGRIGLFYESRDHKDIVLARFGLEWLMEE